MNPDLDEKQRSMAIEMGTLQYEEISSIIQQKLNHPWDTDKKYGTYVRKSIGRSRAVVRYVQSVKSGKSQHAVHSLPVKKLVFIYFKDKLLIQAFNGEKEVKLGPAIIKYNVSDFYEQIWVLLRRAGSRLSVKIDV